MQQPALESLVQQVQGLQQAVDYLGQSVMQIRRRFLAVEAEARLAREGRRPRFPVEFRSEYGEDMWLWDLFEGKTGGYFIEVGAYDGYRSSVSYAFEASGWTGLLVEALPNRHAECAARRTGSRVVHSALGAPGSPGTVEFTAVKDGQWDQCSYAFDRPEHRQALDSRAFARERVTVPMTTMDAVLAAAPPTGPIDFASIDVEGGEYELLTGFDLSRWKPRVVFLEDNTQGRDTRVADHMKRHPYRFLGWLAVNQIYVLESETALLERAPQVRI